MKVRITDRDAVEYGIPFRSLRDFLHMPPIAVSQVDHRCLKRYKRKRLKGLR